MNPLNNASFEASKRLVDNGIVLETDCFHRVWTAKATGMLCVEVVTRIQMLFNKHGDDVGDGRDQDGVTYLPAPSMAEVWREFVHADGVCLRIGISNYQTSAPIKNYGGMQGMTQTYVNTNPTDALIDLLIWARKEKP